MNNSTKKDKAQMRQMKARLKEQKKFYPPLPPTLTTTYDPFNPVTNNSPMSHILMVEYMARSFQQEAAIIFNKPDIRLQFDILTDDVFEAWLFWKQYDYYSLSTFLSPDLVTQKLDNEGIRLVDVHGVCLFMRDDRNARLTASQAAVSKWIATFAWVNPNSRRKGVLNEAIASISTRGYGNFWVEGPVSAEMKLAMQKYAINPSRVILPK